MTVIPSLIYNFNNGRDNLGITIHKMSMEVSRLEEEKFAYSPSAPEFRAIDAMLIDAENKLSLLRSLVKGANGRNNWYIPCEDVLNAKIDFYMRIYTGTANLAEYRKGMQECVELRNSFTGRA